MVNALLSQLVLECVAGLNDRKGCIFTNDEVDQTKHEIFCVHIICNEIQVKVNLEITTFFFYLRFPYCPNFFWFGVIKYVGNCIPGSVVKNMSLVVIKNIWLQKIMITLNILQGHEISDYLLYNRLTLLTTEKLWLWSCLKGSTYCKK